jgi:hypothetical protein
MTLLTCSNGRVGDAQVCRACRRALDAGPSQSTFLTASPARIYNGHVSDGNASLLVSKEAVALDGLCGGVGEVALGDIEIRWADPALDARRREGSFEAPTASVSHTNE